MLTKYASLESVQVLDLLGSKTKVHHASLGKLADFEQYRTEDGFLYARIRAISSRVNKNHDGWPSIELAGGPEIFEYHTAGFTLAADEKREHGFSTFLGKPIFVDHNNTDPGRARGVIVDAKLHVEDHKTSSNDPYYSSRDVDPEHLPGTWIELLLEVDAKSFPKLAKAIVEGGRNPKKGIDGWSMGCDVEKSVCSICKNAASSPEDYCNHVRMKGAIFDFIDPDGRKTSKKAYENCYGIKFFEISAVFDPADETALSHQITAKTAGFEDEYPEMREAKTQEETITQDPKTKSLKDQADDQMDDFLEETERGIKKRKKGATYPGTEVMCPNCAGDGIDESEQQCPMCSGLGYFRPRHPGTDDGYVHQEPRKVTQGWNDTEFEPDQFGPVHQGNRHMATPTQSALGDVFPDNYAEQQGYATCKNCQKPLDYKAQLANKGLCMNCLTQGGPPYQTQANPPYQTQPQTQGVLGSVKYAENPLPQSELYHAPENVDTLREEEVCPVCGSSMDEDTCDVCGYQEPPEGFDNPDLTKAQTEEPGDMQGPDMSNEAPPTDLNTPPQETPAPVNTPNNPSALSHVKRDMDWQVSHTSARINKIEKPLVSTNQAQTNEPQERILEDQTKPVTSKTYKVRTAEDFIAAAGATRRNMKTADTADSVAKPDVHTDVIGVGGVDQASNDAASKADAQVDVLGIGSTGVDSVAAEKEGVNVEQGDEHSKNLEAIPTKTWSGDGPGNGDSLGQQSPVTSETPSWVEESKWSSWHLAYEDGPFPAGEEGLAGGTAVQGNQPIAESFGDRVNVLEHMTSPANNSGPTKTWTGTEGNGVNKQQDPVTPESIARGESGMEDAPNWNASTHIFAAFKLADMEVDLGLITPEARYTRAAELERESSEKLAASLQYAQRIKRASRKVAGTQRLPVMGRSDMEKDASVKEAVNAEAPPSDDSFMFGGV